MALCAGVEEKRIVLDDSSTVDDGMTLAEVELLDVLSTELEVGVTEEVGAAELLEEDSIELEVALVDDATDELEEGVISTDEEDRGSSSALPPSTSP